MEEQIKQMKAKVIFKHETAEDWAKSSYVPGKGEIVVYDGETDSEPQRFKLGDGEHIVKDLPFASIDLDIVEQKTVPTCRHLRYSNGGAASSVRLYGFKNGEDVWETPQSLTSKSESNDDIDINFTSAEKYLTGDEVEKIIQKTEEKNGQTVTTYWYMGHEVVEKTNEETGESEWHTYRYKNTPMRRDGNGRCSVLDPAYAKHIANKQFVENSLKNVEYRATADRLGVVKGSGEYKNGETTRLIFNQEHWCWDMYGIEDEIDNLPQPKAGELYSIIDRGIYKATKASIRLTGKNNGKQVNWDITTNPSPVPSADTEYYISISPNAGYNNAPGFDGDIWLEVESELWDTPEIIIAKQEPAYNKVIVNNDGTMEIKHIKQDSVENLSEIMPLLDQWTNQLYGGDDFINYEYDSVNQQYYAQGIDKNKYDLRADIKLATLIKGIPVKRIAESAFSGWSTNISKVVLPNNLTTVDNNAFSNMTNLAEVHFNGSLRDYCKIKWYNSGAHPGKNFKDNKPVHIFINGSEIKHIPRSLNSNIVGYAFYNNTALVSADLENVTSIDSQVFNGCRNLQWVVWPSIKKISSTCFQNCFSLQKIFIPNTVEKIEQKAFNLGSTDKLIVYYSGTEQEWNTLKANINTDSNAAILNPNKIVFNASADDVRQ